MGAADFIDLVPKDVDANLVWRLEMRRAAAKDRGYQQAFYDAAMDDVLFFFNAFCMCYEPRALIKVRPMVTWPHQDPAIQKMDDAITRAEATEEPVDVVVDKSRAQGGTLAYLYVFARRWIRDDFFSAGLVTRNEDSVDSATDPDTLLWKLDWMLSQLPGWFIPGGWQRNLTDHSFLNPAKRSTIVGYAAGQDVGRGGRKTVFAADEIGAKDFIKGGKDYAVMESLMAVTNCIFQVSTLAADTGLFWKSVKESSDSNSVKIVLDWTDNPSQNRLLYTIREGMPFAVRPEEQAAVERYVKENAAILAKLERRGFPIEGKQRSPWYDAQCLRPFATPRSIAQEYDRNPRGAVGKVFDPIVLDRMKERCCRPPVWQGKPIIDKETLTVKGLVRQDNGPLKLWFTPGVDYSAPQGSYALGCDVAAGGSGEMSSNSAGIGIDVLTGIQGLEYVTMGVEGIRFARIMVALARWLHNAYLGWEASGITSAFAREILEVLYYSNVYYRDVEEIGSTAKTRKAGWYNGGDDDKAELFEQACLAMDDEQFIPRSEAFIVECGEYEWDGGKIIHRPSKDARMDGKAHGDRCVAGGVAWLLVQERRLSRPVRTEADSRKAPYGCPQWRHEQAEARKQRSSSFNIHDLMGLSHV